MAISNYTELVAAIKSWAVRSDTAFDAQVGNFIALAEDRLYHGSPDEGSEPLRVREIETDATLTFTTSGAAVPSDYLSMRALTRPSSTYPLAYLPPHDFDVQTSIESSGGVPQYYTVKGSTVELAPAWAGDLDILYYQRLPALTSGTNDILTNYPNVYLFGALIEAFEWIESDARQAKMTRRYNGAVNAANLTTIKGQHSGVPMRMRPKVVA